MRLRLQGRRTRPKPAMSSEHNAHFKNRPGNPVNLKTNQFLLSGGVSSVPILHLACRGTALPHLEYGQVLGRFSPPSPPTLSSIRHQTIWAATQRLMTTKASRGTIASIILNNWSSTRPTTISVSSATDKPSPPKPSAVKKGYRV